MKKLWNILRRLSGDNRGAGIVVVLVSMTCVALMGASMLFMSYTALSMRTTERRASKDFYTVETALEEVRAGVQTIASDAIAVAYKSVLETYSQGKDIGARFEEAFLEALKFKSGTYDPTVLQRYVTSDKVTVSSGDDDPEVDDEDGITLKNICVTYTAENGDRTTITADLVIDTPSFAYTTSAASVTGLPQHAMIAQNDLIQENEKSLINISGSAYVKSLLLKNATGSQMNIANGTFVCAGKASVSGGNSEGRLVTAPDVKFWAERIEVNSGSSVKLSGETRVLDDLELVGVGSTATLNGSYYGFGDGTPDSGSGDPVPNRSSAILVNGRDSTLSVAGLNRMMLAGRAYISDSLYPGASDTAKSVGMIESVAVRVDQQMYLIDPFDLSLVDKSGNVIYAHVPQNPWIPESDDVVTKLNSGDLKPVAAGGFNVTYRVYSYFGGTQNIIYFFLDFGDPVTTEENSAKHFAVNEYFEQRFSQTRSQINGYLGNSSNLNASGTATLGYTISGKDGNYTFSRANGVLFDCTGMRSTFNQLKKTLIDLNPNPGDGVDNPYKYIVKTGMLAELNGGTKTFEDTDSKKVGIVKDGNYTINGDTPTTVRVIIASGNVTVESSYTGLIIAGGNIIISKNVSITADSEGVVKAFKAKSGSEELGNYLRSGGTNFYGENIAGKADGWQLNTLVTYKNWTKN